MLYILIPIHNNIVETLNCLNCINRQTYINYKIIIINDGSTDNSSEIIKQKFPHGTILEGDGNLWWGGSLYKGIEHILKFSNPSDHTLILNNDLIFDNDYFEILINASSNNPDAIIGSLCKDQKTGILIDSGVIIDWKNLKFTPKALINTGNDIIDNIDVLSTRGIIIPVKIILEVGNFIPHLIRHYLSDYEYTIRIKNHGYHLLTSKTAIVLLNTETTGIHTKWSEKQSFKNIFETIFSTKSSSNLKSWLVFIHLCCPTRYKLSCYWKITIGKVLEIIGGKL